MSSEYDKALASLLAGPFVLNEVNNMESYISRKTKEKKETQKKNKSPKPPPNG